MKVLQINKYYYPTLGGTQTFVQQLSEGLHKRGIDVEVLVSQKKGSSARAIINNVPVTYAQSFGEVNSLPISFDFIQRFREHIMNKDIVHIHMPFPIADLSMFLCNSNYKGKVALWWHCDIVKQKKSLYLYRPLMNWLLNRSDVIMAHSQHIVNNSPFLREFKTKVAIIPPIIDSYLLSSSNKLDEDYLNKESVVNVLFVGRLVYYKGCEYLINAFAKVKGARLTIIGDGPLKNRLKEQVMKLNMNNLVSFKNNLSKESLIQEYKKCDFLVLPSVEKAEGFGLVQIEAMAFGKPVINTNLPTAVPTVSVNNVTGFTVQPRNIDALTEAMQRLIDDTQLRLVLGRNAYHQVRSIYTDYQVINKVLNEYSQLVDTGK